MGQAVDNTPPTVTIDQGAGQVDPTSVAPVVFDVVFSEPVTGFATGDVSLSGSAGATTATVSGSGAMYSVSVTGMSQNGSVVASIGAGKAVDGAEPERGVDVIGQHVDVECSAADHVLDPRRVGDDHGVRRATHRRLRALRPSSRRRTARPPRSDS